jgi:uncharacterized membrane protein YoaK (UPF0700 family)
MRKALYPISWLVFLGGIIWATLTPRSYGQQFLWATGVIVCGLLLLGLTQELNKKKPDPDPHSMHTMD